MANLFGSYDPNAEAQAEFSAIPTGEYLSVIVDSDMKPTKSGDGEFLELTYQVSEGEYKGRKVWARLNLKTPNAQAQEIANRQFASIREATGVANPRDSQELHNKPHIIRVEFIPSGTSQKNGYVTNRDANEVKAWKKIEGVTPIVGAASSAPAANQSAETPPWKRNQAA
ncbi:DUF669 domain-containing protein [Xylophilus sp.]|uniref:DUF669 domain-containing protein n=1 Tax=Xylophilus sp. TaxID=2653893 RepID=UPI0013B6C424|nr:DUF669 domain-containing protein [Xylophilus sp.]KAF1045647.1 MAG: hypothetical protein GAK38_02939 [Xylophilus sp.]